MRVWIGIVGPPALAVLVMSVMRSTPAQDAVVNVYNWSDYIGPDVIDGFTKETGDKGNYDVYDLNETLEARLAAGHSGYDIAVPPFVPCAARGRQAGLYAKIDKSKLKN